MATLHSYSKKLTANIPTPMSGLALGLASLGWCISNLFPALFVLKPLSALLAGFILLLLVLKFAHQPALFRADLADPIVGSVLPTTAMTIMVISHSIAAYSHLIATVVWLLAIALHLGLLTSFVYFRSRNFELNQLVPSWFIPPVGFVVADVTFNGMAALQPLAMGLWYLGVIFYLLLLPFMIYRLCRGSTIPQQIQPTIAVMAAPASLCLAGYLSVHPMPAAGVVFALLSIAIIMTLAIYLAFIQLLRLPFSPAFAAYTFPLVIGVTAISKVVTWLGSEHLSQGWLSLLQYLVWFELVVAIAVISHVCIHYVRFLLKISTANSES